MKKIKIFLASSITELKIDRLEVGDFIRQLNDIYFDRGVQFFLINCEDYDKAIAVGGKQSQFDDEIRDSELCFFLFFKKVGDYTRHEFEVALDAFRNTKKPKIVTYFKYVTSPEEATEEVKTFMHMLDGEIKHYYNIYQNIDTLKLGILMQIKLMGLDAEEPRVEDGVVKYGRVTVADTAALPTFTGNKSLISLKDKLKALTARYYELREKLMSDTEDAEAEEEYRKVASEKAETEQAIREAEKGVLAATRQMYENTAKGGLSPRQVAAYRAFERGEYDEALEILDFTEIMKDLSHNQAMSDGYIARIQVNVNELLQRIEVMEADGVDQSEAAEIEKIYETVTELIHTYNGLKKTPLYEYARFLYAQNNYAKAIEIAKQLEYFYSAPNSLASEEEKASLCNLLGILYSDTQRYAEAEEAYKHALEIRERLAQTSPAAFEPNLAMSYNNLGSLYDDTQRYAEAEEAYKHALEIQERLAQNNPAAFEPDLAISYNNLGALYSDTQRYAEAEEAYKHALEIRERLAQTSPAAFEPNLAMSYNNLGSLYDDTQRYAEAEEAYKHALEIQERLAQNNPAAFEPDLAISYNNLGALYSDTQRYAEAEEAYKHALEIRERLARNNPAAFESFLAGSYNNLGSLYDDTQRYAEAEEMYKHALVIYARLAQTSPAAFESFLAGSYNNLGALYDDTQRYAEAEEAYKHALKIRARLARNNPAAFEPDLAASYNNLGALYRATQRFAEAVEMLGKAFALAKRHPQNRYCARIIQMLKPIFEGE